MALFGVAGSVAVELVKVVLAYDAGRQLPARYRHAGFLIARGLLAVTGGLLAIAYGIQSEILAFQVGASTPAILESLARSPPDRPRPTAVAPTASGLPFGPS
jgi:hypothetical protein